jgi:Flp pilus assembly protein TadG
VVEFAVVVPVLLILVMGIIDFGRMYAVAASLAAAARDGARTAAALSDPSNATQAAAVRARVATLFQPMGGAALATANVAVSLDASRTWVTVTVSGYNYVPVTPIARLIGMGTVTLTRTASFRWELSPT